MEYFRLDDSGRLNDTQERLTSRGFGGGDGDDDNPFSALPIVVRPAANGPSGFGSARPQRGPILQRPAAGADRATAGAPPIRPRTGRPPPPQPSDPISGDRPGF